jgi:AT-rich interactive domain-containing protein 2
VSQIATILRNLTFTPENVPIMGKDMTFLRFVLLCCGSQWNNLSQVGWDMLGNISTEITVQCPLLEDILGIATRGLLSENRAVILASLEILNKLGQNESNEDALLRFLEHPVCIQLTTYY